MGLTDNIGWKSDADIGVYIEYFKMLKDYKY